MLEDMNEHVSEWMCYPEALKPSSHVTQRLVQETDYSVVKYVHGPQMHQLALKAVIYPKNDDYPDLYVFKADGNFYFGHTLNEEEPLPFEHLRGRWSNEFVLQRYYDKMIKLDTA